MHEPRNRQDHVWILAGTGEGPTLAKALLERGFSVSVSVVTEAAAQVYRSLPLTQLWIGALPGVEAIVTRVQSAGVTALVDATHPFATQITAQLMQAAAQLGCRLLRFERPMEPTPGCEVIEQVEAIPTIALSGKRWLLAMGARHLGALAPPLRTAGAQLHARVLPTPLALRQAVAAGFPDARLALLRPQQGDAPGLIERALCRRWGIDAVICRQSGGVSERCWHAVCSDLGLQLWLLRRPSPPLSLELVHSLEHLLSRLA